MASRAGRRPFPKLRYFTVRARLTAFPLDMLRYDMCWPATQKDVHEIECTLNGSAHWRDGAWIDVRMSSFDEPTVERWKSFGWEVTEVA